MGQVVGQAEIDVRVRDTGLETELRSAEARVESTMRRIDAMRSEAEIRADISDVEKKERRAEALLDKWRKKRASATLDVDAKRAEAALAALEARSRLLSKRKITLKAEVGDLLELERRAVSATRQVGRLRGELGGLERDSNKTGRALGVVGTAMLRLLDKTAAVSHSISTLTLRLGPFTGSLKQFSIALVGLAPLLTSLVGGLGALIGVAGTGLVGSMAAGAAGLVGFGLAGTGAFFALKPLVKQIQAAKKAQDAYSTAVSKYGSKSKQAQSAQEKLNSVIGHVSPSARKGLAALGTLQDRFTKLTKPGRKDAFEAFGQGLATVNALLPKFAARTNTAISRVSKGFSDIFKGMRSKDGRETIDAIFRRFNAAIPSVMRGLGALGASFGHILASASRHLEPIGKGFERWAKGIDAATKPGAKLDRTIDRLMSHATSLVHFFAASGRLIAAFFNAGANDGQKMLDSVTNALNGWTAAIKQGSLDQFFKDGAENTGLFVKAMGRLLGLFAKWSVALEPITSGALKFADALGSVVSAIAALPLGQGALASFGATLAAIWTVGKINVFSNAVRGAANALRGLAVAEAGATAAGAAGGLLGGAGRAGAGKAATREAAAVGAASAGSSRGVGLLAKALFNLKGVAGPVGIGLTAIGLAIDLSSGKTRELNRIVKEAQQAYGTWDSTLKGLPALHAAAADSMVQQKTAASDLAKAQKEVNKLESDGKRGTIAYRDAVRNLAAATDADKAARQSANRVRDAEAKSRRALRDAQADQIAGAQVELQEQEANIRAALRHGESSDALAGMENRLSQIYEKQSALIRRQVQAYSQVQLAAVNYARAIQGMPALSNKVSTAFDQLITKVGRKGAINIGTKFADPSQAAKVATTANKALTAGASKTQVLKIVADSNSAEQAIRRLNAIRIGDKRVTVKQAGAEAVQAIISAIGRKNLPTKLQRILQRGGEVTLGMLANVRGFKIPSKSFSVTTQTGQALAQLALIRAGLSAIVSKSIVVSVTRIERSFGSRSNAPGDRGHGNASGRGPGERETSLVGEGRGPELIANAFTGEIRKVSSPTIVSLAPADYVIPSESAYAGRGRELLIDFARTLGIPGFGKGKKARSAGLHSPPKGKPKLPIPDAVRYGAVDENELGDSRDKARDRYQKRKEKVHDLNVDLRGERKNLRSEKDKKKRAKIRKKIEDLERERNRAENGGGGFNGSLPQLQRRWKTLSEQFKVLHKYNAEITRLDTRQNSLRTRMENASKAGDVGAYNAAKGARTPILNRLRDIYAKALGLAKPDSQIQADIEQKLADVEGQIGDQPGFDGGDDSMSLDKFIANLGLAPERSQKNAALALAKALSPGDLNDDRSAARGLVDFYGRVLGAAQGTGNNDLITEAADAFSGARDTAEGLAAPTQDEDAIAEQLRTQLRVALDEKAIANAYVAVAGGPGDIGAGSYSARAAASREPNITYNINTLHPGDPSTLRAIGDAAASGFGYQGYVSSPRFRTGY